MSSNKSRAQVKQTSEWSRCHADSRDYIILYIDTDFMFHGALHQCERDGGLMMDSRFKHALSDPNKAHKVIQPKHSISYKEVCSNPGCSLPEKVKEPDAPEQLMLNRLINIFLKWLHLPGKELAQCRIHRQAVVCKGNTTEESKWSTNSVNCRTGLRKTWNRIYFPYHEVATQICSTVPHYF